MVKVKLKLLFNHKAAYFINWELPHFQANFELVDEASEDAVLFAYGPDAFFEAVDLLALKRVGILFPGFDFNPYHNEETRATTLDLIRDRYDAVFVNPGPVEAALEPSGKTFSHPFSIDVDKLRKFRRIRKDIKSLVHVSADSPQKDWERSEQIMKLSGLRYEVYPPRKKEERAVTIADRIRWRYNKYIVSKISPTRAFRHTLGYVDHEQTIRKYVEYDGFVHIAAEKPLPNHLDGKYTAALFEAAVTGSIVFWHDTFGSGNDFETIFSLPKEPDEAASEIVKIASSIDVEKISAATSDEVSDRCDPKKVVEYRRKVIESIL